MFKVAQERKVKWPVRVSIPVDGGRTRLERFTAEFSVLSAEESDAIIRGVDPERRDILDAVLVGWDEVADEKGEPVAFDEEAKRSLINIPYVRAALIAAYGEVMSGAGARKN